MKNCIVMLGNSRSGKDTAAEYFIDKHEYRRLHCIQDLKTWLCEHYGLPHDACDKDKYLYPSITSKYNLQEIQVKLWDFWKEIDSEFTYPYVYNKLLWGLGAKNYVVTGVRRMHEAFAIRNACQEKNANLYIIRLIRDKSYQEVSDMELKAVFDILLTGCMDSYTVYNNGTLDEFHTRLATVNDLIH